MILVLSVVLSLSIVANMVLLLKIIRWSRDGSYKENELIIMLNSFEEEIKRFKKKFRLK